VSGHGVGSPLLAVSAANLLSAGSLPDTDFRGPGAVVAWPNDVFRGGRAASTSPPSTAPTTALRSLAYCDTAHPAWPAPAASGWAAWSGPCGIWSSRPARSPQKLAATREKADSITQVVTTTTQVAGQTNLLSINAAVEPEKAGEHGRSFLVAAREARRLAGQTAVATLDIGSMVRLTQGAVSAGVMQTDQFGEEVRSGQLPHHRAARRPQGGGRTPACSGRGDRGHSTARPHRRGENPASSAGGLPAGRYPGRRAVPMSGYGLF
jgi:hypothetical protein